MHANSGLSSSLTSRMAIRVLLSRVACLQSRSRIASSRVAERLWRRWFDISTIDYESRILIFRA